jgi:hypothetical protein
MSLPAWKTLTSVWLISTASVNTSGHWIALIATGSMPSTMATERQRGIFCFWIYYFFLFEFSYKDDELQGPKYSFLRRPTFLVCVPFDFLRENRYQFHAIQYLSSLTAAVVDGLAFNSYFKVHKTKGRTLFVVYV